MTQADIANELNAIWQRLSMRWEDSEQVWQDAVRQDFDKRFMTPLEAEMLATIKETQNLLEVIAKARRDAK